ncbi:MAG: hypothetical protein U0800_10060 [Isosphaeraceae bacterium]
MARIDRRRLPSMLIRAVALLGTAVAAWLSPDLFNAFVPVPYQKRLALAMLWVAIILYVTALILGPIVTAAAIGMARQSRRLHRKVPPRIFAALAMGLATLFGLGLMEAGAATYTWISGRLPEYRVPPEDRDPRELNLVVLGESSAMGEPFDPDLSVGQILEWQLQRALPDRRVHVEILAKPGIGLDQAIEPLAKLAHRPHAILLYSGHNEFQGRFSWSRSVDHYRSDPLLARWSPLQAFARVSFVAALINQGMERYRLSFAPPRKITRSLVDYPTCTPFEAEGIARLFEANLGRWLTYCRRAGVVPLAISPPINGRMAPADPNSPMPTQPSRPGRPWPGDRGRPRPSRS